MGSKFLKHRIPTSTQIEIMQRGAAGESVHDLAREYKLHHGTVASMLKLEDIKFHLSRSGPHRCNECGTLIKTTECVRCTLRRAGDGEATE
jgi:hypothetical protein